MPNNTGPMTKDNMVELLPCPMPWCEALERDGDYPPVVRLHHFGNYRVVCTSCVCEGPLRATEAEAIAAWNTRATMHGSDSGVTEALDALRVAADVCELDENPIIQRQAVRIRAAIQTLAMSSASAPDSGALREALVEARRFMTTHPKELAAKIDAALNLSSETGE